MGFVTFILIINQVRSLMALDGLMRVLATIGWILFMGGVYTLAFEGYQSGERLKVFGINENTFGTLLILMMSGVIWTALRASGLKRRIYVLLGLIYVLSTIIMVPLTGSRGGFLSLIIVLSAFWFWRPLRPWAFAGVGGITCILAAAPFVLSTLMTRIESQQGGELGGRLVLWNASILLLQDHPLSGTGIGNGPSQLRWYIKSLELKEETVPADRPSHNPILEAGVETGLIGVLIYVGICAAALWQFFRDGRQRQMREGSLGVYFPLILGTVAGYLTTWIKGGGMEIHMSYFLLLVLLCIPTQLRRPGASTNSYGKRRLF
jgi:O-antigen ligase